MAKKIHEEQQFRQRWVQHIKQKGEEIIKDPEIQKKSFKMIEDLLTYKQQTEGLISKVFSSKEEQEPFKFGIKESFEYFLNINPNQIAEYLAKYLDLHLKKSGG